MGQTRVGVQLVRRQLIRRAGADTLHKLVASSMSSMGGRERGIGGGGDGVLALVAPTSSLAPPPLPWDGWPLAPLSLGGRVDGWMAARLLTLLNGRAAGQQLPRAALEPWTPDRLAANRVCILPGQPDVQYSAGQLKIVAFAPVLVKMVSGDTKMAAFPSDRGHPSRGRILASPFGFVQQRSRWRWARRHVVRKQMEMGAGAGVSVCTSGLMSGHRTPYAMRVRCVSMLHR